MSVEICFWRLQKHRKLAVSSNVTCKYSVYHADRISLSKIHIPGTFIDL